MSEASLAYQNKTLSATAFLPIVFKQTEADIDVNALFGEEGLIINGEMPIKFDWAQHNLGEPSSSLFAALASLSCSEKAFNGMAVLFSGFEALSGVVGAGGQGQSLRAPSSNLKMSFANREFGALMGAGSFFPDFSEMESFADSLILNDSLWQKSWEQASYIGAPLAVKAQLCAALQFMATTHSVKTCMKVISDLRDATLSAIIDNVEIVETQENVRLNIQWNDAFVDWFGNLEANEKAKVDQTSLVRQWINTKPEVNVRSTESGVRFQKPLLLNKEKSIIGNYIDGRDMNISAITKEDKTLEGFTEALDDVTLANLTPDRFQAITSLPDLTSPWLEDDCPGTEADTGNIANIVWIGLSSQAEEQDPIPWFSNSSRENKKSYKTELIAKGDPDFEALIPKSKWDTGRFTGMRRNQLSPLVTELLSSVSQKELNEMAVEYPSGKFILLQTDMMELPSPESKLRGYIESEYYSKSVMAPGFQDGAFTLDTRPVLILPLNSISFDQNGQIALTTSHLADDEYQGALTAKYVTHYYSAKDYSNMLNVEWQHNKKVYEQKVKDRIRPDEEDGKKWPWWPWLIIGIAALAILIAGIHDERAESR